MVLRGRAATRTPSASAVPGPLSDQQRQLERVCEPEPGKLLGRRLGDH
jgi:hypothetical protein